MTTTLEGPTEIHDLRDIPEVDEETFDAALAAATTGAPKWQPAADEDEEEEPLMFEGRPVDRTEIKITGTIALGDAYQKVKVGIDDRVRLVVVTRATKVNHYVDKDGQLVRSQELRTVEVDIVPFNPADPTDDGIIRA